ncbi:hypothetical protein EMCRGX_G031900 [Ephydatia muelleri]|eukprot:Em0018g117a
MSKNQSLADLLQQAQQLTTDLQTGGELPRVHRNLQQIAEAGQRLLEKTSGFPDESVDVKASILLGSRGFDVPKLSQKLENLNAAKTLEPIEPVVETDIEGFLRNEHENTLVTVIEQSRRLTFDEAERHLWKSMEGEWQLEKERILNSLLGPGPDLMEVPSEPEVRRSSPLSLQGRSALDAVGMAYAREVYIRNESVLDGHPHSLVTAFYDISRNFADKNIAECWALVKTLLDIAILPPEAYKHRTSASTQQQFVAQARSYLETRYRTYIQETVYGSLSLAQLGGVPGTFQLVRSYLNLKQAAMIPDLEDGLVDDQPVWAMVFYCMRCGSLDDALAAVSKASAAQSCGEFVNYLQEYKNSDNLRLSPSSEAKFQVSYKRQVKSWKDPFKRAVHCVLGHCDVMNNHSDVCVKTDDYMWLKLCQLNFDTKGSHHSGTGDQLTLAQLQHQLLEEYGEEHFSAHQQPYLYFQVLMLTIQFEAAIDFMWRVEQLKTHAVHFAIALYDQNLLHRTNSTQAQILLSVPEGVHQLNFARMVISYTRRFALTDPREALQYFYLLKGLRGPHGEDLFSGCVSDLVMESREFEMLLGRVEDDGTRKPGCVDKFKDDTQDVVEFVAMKAEQKGLYEDAIRLYDLAKKHNKVLEILNRLVSHVVSSPCVPHTDRDRLQSLAVHIAERYRSHPHTASGRLSHTFFLLLDVMQFFDHYHAKRWNDALDVMKQLRLLPLQPGETVEQKVTAFQAYDDEVRQCFPDILLATMSILYNEYKQTSYSTPHPGTPRQDGGQETRKNHLRQLARTLITFAGMIPYQMPGDTNARLVQMDVLMG